MFPQPAGVIGRVDELVLCIFSRWLHSNDHDDNDDHDDIAMTITITILIGQHCIQYWRLQIITITITILPKALYTAVTILVLILTMWLLYVNPNIDR